MTLKEREKPHFEMHSSTCERDDSYLKVRQNWVVVSIANVATMLARKTHQTHVLFTEKIEK